VIMGSANLNDRSQMGDHDSEIAMIVEDQDLVRSRMNGEHVSDVSYCMRIGK
jgi:phospholipase D1/2